MLEENPTKYYLFALANFVAAFGGGMILGKGISAINTPFLQGSSILAFFAGSIVGLVFLQVIPKKESKAIACWFSIFAAITSIALLHIFNKYAIDDKLLAGAGLIFFIFLSVRFAFWFYSRVLRASATAGKQQRIAWVEFGYCSGMVFGLIIWKMIGIDIGMKTALVLDIFLQLSAGFLDFLASRFDASIVNNLISDSTLGTHKIESPHIEGNKVWGWRLATSATFLTINIQVIIFNLAHQVSESLGSYIIAFFYIGVSLAAVFCRKFKIQLDWTFPTNDSLGYAIIQSNASRIKLKISFLLSSFLSTLGIIIVVFSTFSWHGEIFLLVFVIASAFMYETLALAILDRIGLETSSSNNNEKMVVRTYGLMSIGAAIGLWILGITNSSLLGIFITLFLSLLFTVMMVWKRHFVIPT